MYDLVIGIGLQKCNHFNNFSGLITEALEGRKYWRMLMNSVNAMMKIGTSLNNNSSNK